MLRCPVCGWQMRRPDIHPGRFLCPGCKIGLHLSESTGYEQATGLLGGALLAFLLPYLIGARGFLTLYLCVVLLCVPMDIVLSLVLFPPALRTDSPIGPRPGNILHIDDSPDPRNKP